MPDNQAPKEDTNPSENKKIKEPPNQSEQLYHNIFASMSEMFQVFDLVYDDRCKVIDYVYRIVNPAVSKFTGLSSKQLVGKSVKDLAGGVVEDYWLELLGRVDKTGKPTSYENYGAALGKYYSIYAWKIADKRVAVIAADITERKKAEQALKSSEEQFRRAIRDAPIPIIMHAEDGEVLQLSKTWTELTGYSLKDVPNFDTWLTKAVYGEGANAVRDHMHALFAGRMKSIDIEFPIKALDGTTRYWSFSASSPGRLDDGRRFIVGMAVDITDHKRAEEALKASEKHAKKHVTELKRLQKLLEIKNVEVEQFATKMESLAEERAKKLQNSERLAAIGATAGMVGHDIRNPLQAITGDIYLLNYYLADLPDSYQKSEMKESIDSINTNVSYINKIVADLQDFSKVLTPEYSTFDLPKLINETIKTIFIPQNIKLSVNAETIRAIKSDQTYLRRSITNLVNNAIQAMPKGGNLEIGCFARKSSVFIVVSDTGVGIPKQVKAKLFTPMMTTKSKGQGLGLAVVKRLVEALGGTISFESEEGKGTKFIIQVPF